MDEAHQDANRVVVDNDDRERASTPPVSSVGDLDLIRWTLSLSPEERLSVLQDFVDTFWTPQHG